MSQKSTPKPAQPVPEYVVAPRGTTVFEALNFERYVVRSLSIPRLDIWRLMTTAPEGACQHLLGTDTALTDSQHLVCAPGQCPTPKMRMLGYMGTAAFMGFMGYMLYQREEMTQQQKVERSYRPA